MSCRNSFTRGIVVIAAAVVLAVTGCGEQSEDVVGSDSPATLESEAPEKNLDRFCASLAALDQTDGTTETSVVLDAIDEFRESAPAAIRNDVNLLSDTLIVNNYPSSAEPWMQAAPFDQHEPASARLAAYVEANCT